MVRGVRVACVVGTRPEAVKLAPVVLRLRREGSGFDPVVVASGQHRDLLPRGLADFGLSADVSFDVMRPGQSLAALTSRTLEALDGLFQSDKPDYVLAVGDTTTVFCAALAAQYHRVPFGHVEAGLRTGRADSPFPEEKNRVLATHLASLHFAPTESARRNLLAEGIQARDVIVTGNPVIDALNWTARRDPPLPIKPPTKRFLLVTAHRRENWGNGLSGIARALRSLVDRFDDLGVIVPVHPAPAAREAFARELAGLDRVRLIEPVSYPGFVALLRAAHIVLTDSGGVQEEAPALGKPVLVLRDTTERPEAIAAGTARLVGTNPETIISAVSTLWTDPDAHQRVSRVVNPYGDGLASERIARALCSRFHLDPGPEPIGLADWPHARPRSTPLGDFSRGPDRIAAGFR